MGGAGTKRCQDEYAKLEAENQRKEKMKTRSVTVSRWLYAQAPDRIDDLLRRQEKEHQSFHPALNFVPSAK